MQAKLFNKNTLATKAARVFLYFDRVGVKATINQLLNFQKDQ